MDVPVVTAEVAVGAVTPPDMAYVVDELQRTCGERRWSSPPRTSSAFGPDPSGVSFAEATLILTWVDESSPSSALINDGFGSPWTGQVVHHA